MKIPQNAIDHIKAEVEKINYGRVVLEINSISGKLDIITESRERFPTKEKDNTSFDRTGEVRND